VLCEAVAGQAAKVVAALQARHAEVAAELVERGARLPLGVGDRAALERGGETREDYLAAGDLTAAAGQLRAALNLVEDSPPAYLPDGDERCLAWEQTGALYTGAWLAPTGTTRHGDLGSLPFWLNASHEPGYRFWLPTTAEWRARCAEWREQRQADRVAGRLAGAHVL
jgi:hypothetical protein